MTMTREEFVAALPRKVVGAGALVVDGERRVLLVKPTYKEGWEVPGGTVETGESARDACAREVREELGAALPVGRLLVVEHQTLPDDKGDSIMFVYDGGTLADTAGLTLPADELAEARFVTVGEAGGLLPPRQARRIAAAHRARTEGTLVELVDGEPRG